MNITPSTLLFQKELDSWLLSRYISSLFLLQKKRQHLVCVVFAFWHLLLLIKFQGAFTVSEASHHSTHQNKSKQHHRRASKSTVVSWGQRPQRTIKDTHQFIVEFVSKSKIKRRFHQSAESLPRRHKTKVNLKRLKAKHLKSLHSLAATSYSQMRAEWEQEKSMEKGRICWWSKADHLVRQCGCERLPGKLVQLYLLTRKKAARWILKCTWFHLIGQSFRVQNNKAQSMTSNASQTKPKKRNVLQGSSQTQKVLKPKNSRERWQLY